MKIFWQEEHLEDLPGFPRSRFSGLDSGAFFLPISFPFFCPSFSHLFPFFLSIPRSAVGGCATRCDRSVESRLGTSFNCNFAVEITFLTLVRPSRSSRSFASFHRRVRLVRWFGRSFGPPSRPSHRLFRPTVSSVPPSRPSHRRVPPSRPSHRRVPPSRPSHRLVRPTVSSVPPSRPTVSSVPPSRPTVSSVPPSRPTVSSVPPSRPSHRRVPPSRPSHRLVPPSRPSHRLVRPTVASHRRVRRVRLAGSWGHSDGDGDGIYVNSNE